MGGGGGGRRSAGRHCGRLVAQRRSVRANIALGGVGLGWGRLDGEREREVWWGLCAAVTSGAWRGLGGGMGGFNAGSDIGFERLRGFCWCQWNHWDGLTAAVLYIPQIWTPDLQLSARANQCCQCPSMPFNALQCQLLYGIKNQSSTRRIYGL